MALPREQQDPRHQVTGADGLLTMGDDFDALTFDCYGTLIDWERGILGALRVLLGQGRPRDVSDEELLQTFGRFEPEEEAGAFRSYRAVLEGVAKRFGDHFDVPVPATAARTFAASVAEWPAFSDSGEALSRLATRYRLAIVSNVDDDLFAGSARRLGVAFDEVVTAQQVGSYKPARAHFDEALRRLDLTADRVLHVAQSLYHDIAPATALGFTCVWVNRRGGEGGGGATPPAEARPHATVPDLASLAGHLVPE